MRTFGLFCLWLLLSAFSPAQQIIAFNPQQRPDNASAGLPAVDDSLTGGGYPLAGGNCAEWGHRVPCNNHYSTTRAQTVPSYCTSTDGLLAAVNANVMRLCNGNGALIEEARTNSALWARDMTNAAWVKVGMGNALNATGADGVANSATTLTATGTAGSCTASCTILQTLTLGSAADTYSVYLMRVTGSGAVNITINNLVGTTACTLVTTGFTRCSVTATLANPVIGIQLTTLNDVVIADFNQLEAGTLSTSAIPTTTASVTRAADAVTATGVLLASITTVKSLLFQTNLGTGAPGSLAALHFAMITSNEIGGFIASNQVLLRNQALNTAVATLGSGTYAGIVKTGYGFDQINMSTVANNGTVATSANAWTYTGTAFWIGNRATLDRSLDGYLSRLSLWNSRLSDVTLKAMTQ